MKTLADMTILIVGLGQIGGSLGLDLVRDKLVREVWGFDSDPTAGHQARERDAIHSLAATLDEGIANADLVIMATPIRQMINMLPRALARIDAESAVLDVGSTKGEILGACASINYQGNYIGGHPLAGTEKAGLAGAEPGIFKGRTFVLVPAPGTTTAWVERISALVIGLGAEPLMMAAAEHDRLFALTSGLPHVFALALCRLALRYQEKIKDLPRMCGGSFHGAARVAGSSPDLIVDMFLTNQSNISRAIDEIIIQMKEIKKSIVHNDERSLRAIIDDIQQRCPGLSNE